MQELFIIRGLPGSGKTTLAKMLSERYNFNHFETDMFFMQDGEYIYNANKIKEANTWCKEQVEMALFMGQNVVVSNTFVKLIEMQPYKDLAKKYMARLSILECNGEYESIHNVPQETIKRMKETWES